MEIADGDPTVEMSKAAAPPFFFWRDEYFVIDSWIVHDRETSSLRIGEINYIDDAKTNSTAN